MTDKQIGIGVVIFLLIIILGSKGRRSRHIPTRVKRQALARFYKDYYDDPETRDKPLHSKEYEFDHHVPFSKGGEHNAENLRVIPKKQNRKKGAKMPSFWNR